MGRANGALRRIGGTAARVAVPALGTRSYRDAGRSDGKQARVSLLATIRADLQAALDRDPAARGPLDVILSYPGFHAVTAHRLIHPLQRAGVPLLPRFLAHIARFLTGIEI